MPDLETLLREVRPVPDGAWAQRLDARVSARFPGPPPRWKAALDALRAHFMAIGAVGAAACVLMVVIVAANSSDSGESSTAGSSSVKAMSAESAKSSDSSGASSGSAAATPMPVTPASAGGSGPAPSSARAVRSSAALTLSTPSDQVATVTDRAIRVVDGLDGFVQSSEVSSVGAHAGSTLALKVPSARLETALSQLSRLAHVKARSQQSEDLTDQKAALEASVRDARADVAGLRARLAKAETEKERAKLRAELDTASKRVTRRERDVANLGREVSYATVALEIVGTHKTGAAPVKPGDHWTPGDAVHDAGRVLEVIAGVLVIALAILIPVGLIALVIALLSRVFVRRARERALEMA